MQKIRKPMRLKNFDYSSSGHVYFITLCTVEKKPILRNARIAEILIDEMKFRTGSEIKLYAYCVMPDHLHLLLSLADNYGKTLQNWVAAYKRYTARNLNLLFAISPLWQTNFYDHVVRNGESLIEVAKYILNNPVRKGMVQKSEDYPFSGLVDPLPV